MAEVLPEVDPNVSAEDWQEWLDFCDSYSRGDHDTQGVPPPPAVIRNILDDPDRATLPFDPFDLNARNPSTPLGMLQHYRNHGFFPAPPGPHDEEEKRQRAIRKFNLEDRDRRRAIDRTVGLVKNLFDCEIVMISWVLPSKMVLIGELGWEGPNLYRPPDLGLRDVGLPCSFCPHTLLNKTVDDVTLIYNAKLDWRWSNNPFVAAGGIGFYASCPIAVPNDDSSGCASNAFIGALCVISPHARPVGSFTKRDQETLVDIAHTISRELQLGAEIARRKRETDQTEFIGKLLRSSLAETQKFGAPQRTSPGMTAVYETQSMSSSRSGKEEEAPLAAAAKTLSALTDASGCRILDLRNFQPVKFDFKKKVSSVELDERASHTIAVLASTGFEEADARLNTPDSHKLLRAAMATFYNVTTDELLDSGMLEPFFPSNAKITAAVPIMSVDHEMSLVVLLSSASEFTGFTSQDVKFARDVGVACLLGISQQKVFEADRAKLAFVSHISHELRTPVYAITSHIEMVKEEILSPRADRRRVKRLLDVAEVSLDALRDTLDDSLDYTKLRNNHSPDFSASPPLRQEDISDLVTNVARMSLLRSTKAAAAMMDQDQCHNFDGESYISQVELIVEIAPNAHGWKARLPSLDFKRILGNVISNALKYTAEGCVRVKVRSQDEPAVPGGPRLCVFEVIDTGCGISEEFLKSGKAFMPFVQENSFAPGAGLGLSMVQSLVTRMGGSIEISSIVGSGTTVTIGLPLQLVDAEPEEGFTEVITNSLSGEGFSSTPATEPGSPDYSNEDVSPTFPPTPPHGGSPPETPHASSLPAMLNIPKSPVAAYGRRQSVVTGTSPNPMENYVLVAEDNAISRSILLALLRKKKFVFHAVDDGAKAVAAYAKYKPFLTIMDVQMPLMDGIEASFEIRKLEAAQGLPRSRIVALSSLSNKEDMLRGLSGGPLSVLDDWIVKGGSSLKLLGELLDNARPPNPWQLPPTSQAFAGFTQEATPAQFAGFSKAFSMTPA